MTERNPRIPEESIITLLSDVNGVKYGSENNPKRGGTPSAERFAKYSDGMSVEQAKEAGITMSDIRYDCAHQYISLTPDPNIAVFVKKQRVKKEKIQHIED